MFVKYLPHHQSINQADKSILNLAVVPCENVLIFFIYYYFSAGLTRGGEQLTGGQNI